jgi:DNA-binding MarR family transcriptional regulator
VGRVPGAVYHCGVGGNVTKAARAAIEPATISSVLSTLDREGCIVKVGDPNDARSIRVDLTDTGWQRIDVLAGQVQDRMGQWRELYTAAEAAILVELLSRMVDGRSPA